MQLSTDRKNTRHSMKAVFFSLGVILALVICAVAMLLRYYPLRYFDIIGKNADEFGLAPEFVCAVIHAESRFVSGVVSSAGASGLMQITESTAYWLAEKMGLDGFDYGNVTEPELNIRLGCFYLDMLIKRYGDMETALCAYNAGSGNVDKWLGDPDYSSDERTLDHIPFPETREYVRRVAKSRDVYSLYMVFLRGG